MIYAEGFSSQDRKQWRVVIFTNLVNAFQTILQTMEEQEVAFSNNINAVRCPIWILAASNSSCANCSNERNT